MAYSRLHRRETKLTCPSPTTGARGPRFHGIGDEEPPYTARDTSFARKLEEAQVVPLAFPYYYNYNHRCNRKERRAQAYSLFL